MNWRKRFKQWLLALRLEKLSAGKLPWLTMLMAIFSGVVPRLVWRERMRICMKCDFYSTVQSHGTYKKTDRLHLCKSSHPSMLGAGCHCAVNISALSSNPYGDGCYGRNLDKSIGWPSYTWPSRLDKCKSVIDFLLKR